MDANPSSLVSLKKSLGLRQTQQRSCEDTKETPGHTGPPDALGSGFQPPELRDA